MTKVKIKYQGWDAKFIDPTIPIMEELKRFETTLTELTFKCKYVFEAMSDALNVMEIRLQKLEQKSDNETRENQHH